MAFLPTQIQRAPDGVSICGAKELALMTSLNFEFLRRHSSTAADIMALAEKYAHPDPRASVVKGREFAELCVEYIYAVRHYPRPFNASLNDLLNEGLFVQTTPRIMRDHFHLLRKLGNRGAHRELNAPPVTHKDALNSLNHAWHLARWMFIEHMGGQVKNCSGSFVDPPPDSGGRTKRENEELQNRLREIEALLTAEREQSRKRAEQTAQSAAEQSAQAAALALSEAQREAMAAHGASTATDALGLNEDETRKRLIDEDLVAAGWDVSDPDQVGSEVAVSGLPQGAGTGGKSGNGKADYVLWDDDGKPLAVIEAKKASLEAEKGRKQASLYADALERATGQRPLIFYTNGPEIFLWNDRAHGADQAGYPPRKVYGYYSKASLQTQLFRRTEKDELAKVGANPKIVDRLYQIEAVKRVTERFGENHRRVLVVQATGTGKTRVAVALCEVLLRAKWAKRVLFLCDRRELRKQALSAFKEHLPDEPRVEVSQGSAGDTEHRIFVATYPGMMSIYESFDIGFFDLIIADESHRSIYNKYRDLFDYFDCLQVGLTATPVKFVERNTYKLFKCEDKDPTFNYEYDDAIKEGYLSPFEVVRVTTKYLREGIKYSAMSDEEKRALEEALASEADKPESIEFDAAQIDKQIFNTDTTRHILRNLMDNGLRDASGSLPGKTIIFARSHDHAKHLESTFYEMYPQYGGGFARVIDSHEADAETMIGEFKDPKHELTIAISVDMLDTGIDVPEIVNLVFAKPVKSYVKFWQMIGRGTRLCKDLYGPGRDKHGFVIFDHWDNFVYFDEKYKEKEPAKVTSLQERLLTARVELLEAAIASMDEEAQKATTQLILAQLNALRSTSAIPVREHWKELEIVSAAETIASLGAVTRNRLLNVAAPLMRLVNIRGEEAAYHFDLLTTRLQTAKLRQLPAFDDLRATVQDQVEALAKNINQVKAKADSIKKVRSPDFWKEASPSDLEALRGELRGIMKHQAYPDRIGAVSPKVYDFRDSGARSEAYETKLTGLNLVQYRNRVKKALEEHFVEHLVYRKIRSNIRVSDDDLEKLAQMVLDIDQGADLHQLLDAESERFKGQLYFALKSVVGLDREAVDEAFKGFVAQFPKMSARQIHFLTMIKAHICSHGLITIEQLDEGKFIQFDAGGLDALFPDDEMVSSLLGIIASFDPQNVQSESAG